MQADRRDSTFRIGRTVSGYMLRVEGRGTLQESPAIHDFAARILDQGPEAGTFVIDLAACDYLDSTFLGCLVMLHRRYNHPVPHRFRVAASAEKCQKLLAPTRL